MNLFFFSFFLYDVLSMSIALDNQLRQKEEKKKSVEAHLTVSFTPVNLHSGLFDMGYKICKFITYNLIFELI